VMFVHGRRCSRGGMKIYSFLIQLNWRDSVDVYTLTPSDIKSPGDIAKQVYERNCFPDTYINVQQLHLEAIMTRIADLG
jgi:hypothetical protein